MDAIKILAKLNKLRDDILNGRIPDDPEDTLTVAFTKEEFYIVLYTLSLSRVTDNELFSHIQRLCDKLYELIDAQKFTPDETSDDL